MKVKKITAEELVLIMDKMQKRKWIKIEGRRYKEVYVSFACCLVFNLKVMEKIFDILSIS